MFWTLLANGAEDGMRSTVSTTTTTATKKTTAAASGGRPETNTGTSTRTISPHANDTRTTDRGFGQGFKMDSYMIQRALYVLIGITVIGLLYFLVRAVRLKKTTTQRKKYGLLSNYDDTMEMAPLESDEDDMTVYEAKALRR
uniref:Family with sequence similarity 174 member C n=3 Tax=Scleropages formosus TaxID=113540 RepID=A0A8C9SL51_SCLFO